ncbi:MAG TPA: DUF559 domain-containing protein [Pseudoxanthomonas sp.]|nr:DUF559 domain-containing protein [Pseudoxanthomonas sp.]
MSTPSALQPVTAWTGEGPVHIANIDCNLVRFCSSLWTQDDAFSPFPRLRGKVGMGAKWWFVQSQEVHMRNGQKRGRARELRCDMTLAERRLWSILRQRQLEGFRFRRQCPIGPYITDFACIKAGLIIEVDGGQHMGAPHDCTRDAFLRREGFHVLRFWNNEVMTNLEGVRARISFRLAEACPHPSLPPQAEEGANHEG